MPPGANRRSRRPRGAGAQLAERGLRPKRHFGQNFLTNVHHARRIAELATTPPEGTVVEIGAGLGALTRPLLDRAGLVVAVERDRDLVPALREALRRWIDAGTLVVEEADAKQLDLATAFRNGPRPHVLAGNLPYSITGPLLERTVDAAALVDRAVFLLQAEVARRLVATPATPAYGALTVFVQAAFRARRPLAIRRGAFHPQPRVDSAVVVLEPRSQPLAEETEEFTELVRKAFGQRRKKLRNAWRGACGLADAALERAAGRAGVDLDARGETLAVVDFRRMAQEASCRR